MNGFGGVFFRQTSRRSFRNSFRNSFRIIKLLPMVLLLTLSACAGGNISQPTTDGLPEAENQPAWNARFPHDRYITAWGISNKSQRLAEQDAKAMVAAAVRSSIESELVSVMESETWNSKSNDYQKLESRTKISAHFDHAELIRIVPPTAHQKNNEFRVLAVLSRREAAEELLIPYEVEAADFRLLKTHLDSLENDFPQFTKTWNQLKTQHEKMLAPAAEVRAVAGIIPAQIASDDSRWLEASSARLALLNSVVVVVDLAEHPQLDQGQLGGKIHSALVSLGLSTAGSNCLPGALRIKIQPELQWHQVVGRVAQLDLVGEVGLCDSEIPWNTFQIDDPRMRGEGRHPVEDLMGRLDPDFLAERFLAILEIYLPL